MIMVVGEYIKKESDESNFIDGLGFKVCKEVARLGISVSLETLISSDETGLTVLDDLVTDGVLFDPMLCNCGLPSSCFNKHERLLEGTSATCISEEQLLNSCSNYDDIKVIHFGSFSSFIDPSSNSLMKVMKLVDPSPVFYFNPDINEVDLKNIPLFEDKSKFFIENSDIIQLDDDFLRLIYPRIKKEQRLDAFQNEYEHINIVYLCESMITFISSKNAVDGMVVKKPFESKRDDLSPLVAGVFLAKLHDYEAFGDDLSDPIFKYDEKLISDTLDAIISEIDC